MVGVYYIYGKKDQKRTKTDENVHGRKAIRKLFLKGSIIDDHQTELVFELMNQFFLGLVHANAMISVHFLF